jgi:hypothetical protein
MFQAESNLLPAQFLVAAPKQLLGLFVKFELLSGYFSHGLAPNKKAGPDDRRLCFIERFTTGVRQTQYPVAV